MQKLHIRIDHCIGEEPGEAERFAGWLQNMGHNAEVWRVSTSEITNIEDVDIDDNWNSAWDGTYEDYLLNQLWGLYCNEETDEAILAPYRATI